MAERISQNLCEAEVILNDVDKSLLCERKTVSG